MLVIKKFCARMLVSAILIGYACIMLLFQAFANDAANLEQSGITNKISCALAKHAAEPELDKLSANLLYFLANLEIQSADVDIIQGFMINLARNRAYREIGQLSAEIFLAALSNPHMDDHLKFSLLPYAYFPESEQILPLKKHELDLIKAIIGKIDDSPQMHAYLNMFAALLPYFDPFDRDMLFKALFAKFGNLQRIISESSECPRCGGFTGTEIYHIVEIAAKLSFADTGHFLSLAKIDQSGATGGKATPATVVLNAMLGDISVIPAIESMLAEAQDAYSYEALSYAYFCLSLKNGNPLDFNKIKSLNEKLFIEYENIIYGLFYINENNIHSGRPPLYWFISSLNTDEKHALAEVAKKKRGKTLWPLQFGRCPMCSNY